MVDYTQNEMVEVEKNDGKWYKARIQRISPDRYVL